MRVKSMRKNLWLHHDVLNRKKEKLKCLSIWVLICYFILSKFNIHVFHFSALTSLIYIKYRHIAKCIIEIKIYKIEFALNVFNRISIGIRINTSKNIVTRFSIPWNILLNVTFLGIRCVSINSFKASNSSNVS